MARGQRSNTALVRDAAPALERLKHSVAEEIGLQPPASGYWGDISSRLNGAVGGHMVRRMIEQAEQQLAGRGRARP